MTIIAIALAAIAAVKSYNNKKAADPEGTDLAVRNIKQSTSVVLAIGSAIYAILDALMFLTRTFASSAPSNGGGTRPPVAFGTRVASDDPTPA